MNQASLKPRFFWKTELGATANLNSATFVSRLRITNKRPARYQC